jgi:hypothetical protein
MINKLNKLPVASYYNTNKTMTKEGKHYLCLEHRKKDLDAIICAVAILIFSFGITWASQKFRNYWDHAMEGQKTAYWVKSDLMPTNWVARKKISAPMLRELTKEWKHLVFTDKARKKEALSIKKRYKKLQGLEKKFFGFIDNIPGKYSLHMPGVALAASYLAERHGVQGNLFVAETLEALQSDLKAKIASIEEGRWAYVIPTSVTEPNFPQHKVMLGVERKDGETKIAIIDPQAVQESRTRQNMLNEKEIWAGWDSHEGLLTEEQLLRVLGNIGLPSNAKVYFSTITREASYGCETYSLRDGIAFLKDPAFFSRIESSPSTLHLSSGHVLQKITSLPAAFLLTSQYSAPYKSFIEKHKKDPTKLHVNSTTKSLEDYIRKYSFQVGDKSQNHYITRKMYKYYEVVLRWLENESPEFIQNKLDRTLLTATS